MDQDNSQQPPSSEETVNRQAVELNDMRAERDAAMDATAAARTSEAATSALARDAVRDALRAANPALPASLIDGDTVADVKASLERGKVIAAEVIAAAAAASGNGHAPHVPSGAAAPPAPDVAAMTPGQQIAYGIAQRRAGRA